MLIWIFIIKNNESNIGIWKNENEQKRQDLITRRSGGHEEDETRGHDVTCMSM